jgi:hypothetical protein
LPGARTTTTGSSPALDVAALPELAGVWWRRRVNEQSLRRAGQLWTLTAVCHSVPFVAAAIALAVLKPVTTPVAVVLLIHAWVIPELYAARGASVVKKTAEAGGEVERVAVGLLGDLLGHDARELHARTGLALERGKLGVWLVGEAGALLVRPGGRRVHCYCVKVTEQGLPAGDRIAHLLLALREDEAGFATVANVAFAGAPWRLRRRVRAAVREGLQVAVTESRR